MTAPDEAVVGHLDLLDILETRINLFRGAVRAPIKGKIPDEAVFCLETGGPPPIACVNGNQGPDLRTSSVQIRTRGNPGKFAEGKDLAEQVWKQIHRAEVAGYISIFCRESSPVYIGQDDTEHHEWSTNVDTIREE